MKRASILLLGGLLILSLLAACTLSGSPVPITATPKAGTPPVTAMTPVTTGSEWDSLIAAAKKEGVVVIYHASIGEARDIATKTFKDKYGIALDFITGRGAELTQRISTERNAGLYFVDAMIMGLGTFFNVINPMKITVPLEPFLVLPEVTDGTKWRTGNVPFVDKAKTCIAYSLTGLHYMAINTDMVKEGEITSTEDVMDPKWKGKLVVNDPTVSGSGAEWFQFIMLGPAYGKEKGREYMVRLIRQEPAITRDQRLQAEWVARGRYSIGLGVEPSEVDKMARAGAPIKLIAMKEGKPLSSGPMNVMVFDRAPHPNATKLFVNWVLGQEGGTIMSKYSGYPSARLDVSAADFDPIFIPGPKDILPGEEYKLQAGEMLKLAAEMFKDLLK